RASATRRCPTCRAGATPPPAASASSPAPTPSPYRRATSPRRPSPARRSPRRSRSSSRRSRRDAERRGAMKPRTGVRVGGGGRALGAVALASVALADCVPVVAPGSVNINGIVVGQALGGGGAPPGTCLGDAGWGGVVALTVPPVSGIADTHKVRLFA